MHALVLILGGAYTYARVPAGFWLQDLLALERNPYDRIGHFMQGFVPAMVAREIFLQRGDLWRAEGWWRFLCVCVALAVSAVYELIEWGAALALGQGADEFLGTQGDPWDTQADMFLALIGAVAALLLLSRLHDRQLVAPVGAALPALRELRPELLAAGAGPVGPARCFVAGFPRRVSRLLVQDPELGLAFGRRQLAHGRGQDRVPAPAT